MHAERVFLETDENGNLLAMPKLPPHSRVEAIFLVLNQEAPTSPGPHPGLAGSVQVLGDIVGPVIDEGDWEALR